MGRRVFGSGQGKEMKMEELRKYDADILDRVSELGIKFHVDGPTGSHEISAKVVHRIVSEKFTKDEVIAFVSGVSPEQFWRWQKWVSEGSQCLAMTKKGMRCKGQPLDPYLLEARNFETEAYCSAHS
jgi:hypothetical protein